jgi:hypothetical protein
MNAEKNLVSSSSVVLKPTLMIPNNYTCMYGLNLEGRMLDTILYEDNNSTIL